MTGPGPRALAASGPLRAGSGPLSCSHPHRGLLSCLLGTRDSAACCPSSYTIRSIQNLPSISDSQIQVLGKGSLASLGHMSTPHPTGFSSPGPRISRLDFCSQKRKKVFAGGVHSLGRRRRAGAAEALCGGHGGAEFASAWLWLVERWLLQPHSCVWAQWP